MSDKYAALRAAADRCMSMRADIDENMAYANFICLVEPAIFRDLLAEREADKARIAELEPRKVKLPSINPQMFNDDVMFGYRKAQKEAIEFCAAAGITLETGEQQ